MEIPLNRNSVRIEAKKKKENKQQTCLHTMQVSIEKYFQTDLKNCFHIPSP